MLSIIIKAYQFLQADFWYVRNRTKLAFQKKSSIAIKASKIWGKKCKLYTKHIVWTVTKFTISI